MSTRQRASKVTFTTKNGTELSIKPIGWFTLMDYFKDMGGIEIVFSQDAMKEEVEKRSGMEQFAFMAKFAEMLKYICSHGVEHELTDEDIADVKREGRYVADNPRETLGNWVWHVALEASDTELIRLLMLVASHSSSQLETK